MKSFLNKIVLNSKVLSIALMLVFGVCVYWFWGMRYPFALAYQEQFQLFQCDGAYLLMRLGAPGGVARYVAEFLVQFYNHALWGAAVLAVVYVLMQWQVWQLMQPCATTWLPLSFTPVVLLWCLMGDESVLLSYPVAVILTLGLMMIWKRWGSSTVVGCGLAVLLLAAGYWIAGSVVAMLAVYIVVDVILRKTSLAMAITTSVVAVATVLLCLWGSSLWLPYPLAQLCYGVGYYRFVDTLPFLMVVILAVCVLLPLTAHLLPAMEKQSHRRLAGAGLVMALIVMSAMVVPSGYNAKTYELIEYDYLVRMQRWNDVIRKAEQKTPDLPMSVCATNLALAMTEQLGERAFDFYQRGPEGLIPPFERNFTPTLMTGEIYYRLGLINSAQRFVFEAMECLPDYNKSVRCVRRLAETNLINGEYKVAEKYLKMLEKTTFYRKWARKTMTLLGNEKAINAHPTYGWLRRVRLAEDFLFSEDELDKICGRLVMQNSTNGMALQYLMLYPVLQRDVDKFMHYMTFIDGKTKYNPRICQEMIVFAYAQRRQQPPSGYVGAPIRQHFAGFAQAYSSHGALELYKHTAWYYLVKGQ